MDFNELLARLAAGETLTAEELSALEDAHLAEFETVLLAAFDERAPESGAVSDASLEEAGNLATAIAAVREEAGTRIDAAEERSAKARELAALVHVAVDEPEPEDAPAETPVEDPAPETDAVIEEPAQVDAPVAEIVEVPADVPVAAQARRTVASLAKRVPAKQRPQPKDNAPRVYVRAASGLPSITAGAEFNGPMDIAKAMCDALQAGDGHSGPAFDMRVGQRTWRHAYDGTGRSLTAASSPEANRAVIEAALQQRVDFDGNSLTAAVGGLCAPVPIRYELTTYPNTARPLRDALPGFNADRGGIQFNTAPTLASITTSTGTTSSSAVGIVTVAADASTATKSVQDVDCGSLLTEKVQAIYNRLQFSNFADRYNPERMNAYIGLAETAMARVAERQLLAAMLTGGTLASNTANVKLVNGGTVFIGAARQYVNNVVTAVQNFRYRHRMGSNVTFRAVIPEWMGAVVGLDILNQQPGDDTLDAAELGTDWLTMVLRKIGCEPIFQTDDALANDANGAGAPAWTTQSSGTLTDFPGRVSTLIYPEGTFILLDGGELNFGIVRDSTLNAANRFQTFSEIFEGVAMVGPEAYNLTTLICADGVTTAAAASTKCGGVGS